MRPATLLTTIVGPAADTDLTDLATFKAELEISGTKSDAFISRQITAASTAVQRYCNRIFAEQTIEDQIWLSRDTWPRVVRDEIARLQLSSWPLVSMASVTILEEGVSTALVAGTDYLVDQPVGQLIRLDRFGNPRDWRDSPVAATYVAGYAATPSDVEDAVLRLVKSRWYARQRDPMLRIENIEGVAEATYWFGAGPGTEGDLPPDVMAILDRYRIPVVA